MRNPVRQERPQTGSERSAEVGDKRPGVNTTYPRATTLRWSPSLMASSRARFSCANARDSHCPSGSNRRTSFALATQKLSRVITKDKVTAAFRAPFTEVEGKGGAGELEEHGRGHGLRRAIGDLITCPFCLGTWIASGFIYGFLFTPRLTRILASIFAVSGIADFLQQAYVKAQEINDQI